MKGYPACAIFILLLLPRITAQPIDTVLFTELGRYQHPYVMFPEGFSATTYSSRIDRLDRDYLFMACGSAGLITLDISDPTAPIAVDTLSVTDLSGLHVMNVEQYGTMLILALGEIGGGDQASGVATVDVGDPLNAWVMDLWQDNTISEDGCAIAKLYNGHLYLGAMEHGLIVVDAADPTALQYVSSYQPDPSWPGIASYPPNARGMDIADGILYLAYDAGGLRTIDISNPAAPFQIGQYVNPAQPPLTPPAYNNLIVRDGLAFVSIDFCGLEVVDVSDPQNMTQLQWSDPWSCLGLSWFGSDGHTNELTLAQGDSLLFVSGADSEVLVYDITTPGSPSLKGGHIQPNDTASTWGLDVHGDLVVANFINNHGLPFQPYDSKYGGVVIFHWQADLMTGAGENHSPSSAITVAPNPTNGPLDLKITGTGCDPCTLRIIDVHGRLIHEDMLSVMEQTTQHLSIDLSGNVPGPYFLSLSSEQVRHSVTVLVVGE